LHYNQHCFPPFEFVSVFNLLSNKKGFGYFTQPENKKTAFSSSYFINEVRLEILFFNIETS